VPDALRLHEKEKERVRSMDCFAPDFRGIEHVKECFFFLRLFDFFERFQESA
jgi:hypothetical protein